MIRSVLLALAALAASACSYGSAVDMAPMSARPSAAIFASGDYCEAKDEDSPGSYVVTSSKDCAPITWNQTTRTYTIIDEEAKDKIEGAVAPLGDGLYLAQIEVSDDGKPVPDKYQLQVFLAKGNAFMVLPALEDEPLAKLAAKHKKLVFKKDHRGRFYIASGKPDDVKTFLRAAAREAVREAKADDSKKDDLSVGVHDTQGTPDHPATAAQLADIKAVLQSVDALAK